MSYSVTRYVFLISTIISTSTGIFIGSEPIPTAERAALP
ncbi:uncharacterized protein METZ01_LOCUS455502, partial [marine metagenome]